jgi:CubicO group peptidase (beta-lactamase class C family)
MLRIIFAAAGLLTAGAAAASHSAAQSTPPTVDQVPELAGLRERWTAALKTLDCPGFAVAIVKDGQVLALDALGVRDIKNQPATIDTIYYIASATKPYTAMGLCILANEGKVDLDAPVKKYLPAFELPDAALTARITVRDLLCHRRGLDCGPIVHRDAYTGQITDEIYFKLLRNAEIERQVSYSNIHFTLAGRVIEAVSGQKWQDFLNEHLFQPAGMNRTTAYASKMYGDADHADPMIMLDGQWETSPLIKTDRTMHGAGGMGTCVRDAARWMILNMNQGEIDGTRIVSQKLADEMLAQQSALVEPSGRIRIEQGFGLGWQTGAYRELDRPYRFHGGGYVGASSYIAFLPRERIGVAVLANTDRGGNAMGTIVSIDIFDRLLGVKDQHDLLPSYEQEAAKMRDDPRTKKPRGVNPVSTPDGLSQPAEKYLGTYSNDERGELNVHLNKRQELAINFGDLPIRMFSTGRDEFDCWIAPGMTATGEFEVDADGNVVAMTLTIGGDEVVRFARRDN